jgi:aminoglycoside phosphotransferase (APT) family kinase protein
MHADELDVDVDLVRSLLAAQFPHWADLPLERVSEEGTDNAIFRLGDAMSVRLPRIRWAAGQAERDHRVLTRLAPHLPVAIPRSLAVGEPGEGYPWRWAVHTWLRGDPARVVPVDDLVRLVAALRRIDTDGAPAAFQRVSPAAAERTRAAIEALGDPRCLTVWEQALAAPPWDRAPVWVHADLDARNLLLENGRLAGVLDFGSAGIGDPAADVSAAFKVLPARERDGFRDSLAVDDATWMRARGWIVGQAAMALTYYTLENNRPLVLEARRWLAEVL